MRYFIELIEDGRRFPIGSSLGYTSQEEAERVARGKVDDALPRNEIRIMAHVSTAYLQGDGDPGLRKESA